MSTRQSREDLTADGVNDINSVEDAKSTSNNAPLSDSESHESDSAAQNARAAPEPPDRTHQSLREQKKARSRAQILDSAKDLIARKGYAQTKMRDVANSAGMSYQTLYNYFPTKGLILQELLTQDLVKLKRANHHTLQSRDTLTNKLRGMAKSYIDAIAPDQRHLWKEVCAELLKATSHHSCLLALLDDSASHLLRNLLADAQHRGHLVKEVNSEELAGVVYSLLDAMLVQYLVNENLTRTSMLNTISTQLRLTITPYLNSD